MKERKKKESILISNIFYIKEGQKELVKKKKKTMLPQVDVSTTNKEVSFSYEGFSQLITKVKRGTP